MHAADLAIDPLQQLVRTYKNALNESGTFVTAVDQFESDCLTLLEEGWRLKQVSHQGSILSPYTVVAIYGREE